MDNIDLGLSFCLHSSQSIRLSVSIIMLALCQQILPAGIYGYAIPLFHICVCTYIVHKLWLEFYDRNNISKHQTTKKKKLRN